MLGKVPGRVRVRLRLACRRPGEDEVQAAEKGVCRQPIRSAGQTGVQLAQS